LLLALKNAGRRSLTGVETSAEQVTFAHELGLDFVIQGDLLDALTERKENSQDIVVAFDVLEHFSQSEILAITDEVFRVLRRNGVFLIHVPNAEGIFPARVRFADFTHESAFTRDSL
jgi:predicted SAM-dependent methyltransferase